jgi:hypothetical protein
MHSSMHAYQEPSQATAAISHLMHGQHNQAISAVSTAPSMRAVVQWCLQMFAASYQTPQLAQPPTFFAQATLQ